VKKTLKPDCKIYPQKTKTVKRYKKHKKTKTILSRDVAEKALHVFKAYGTMIM
jgi:hypothetical protein